MNSEWNRLTGKLNQEERELVSYICRRGLKETRSGPAILVLKTTLEEGYDTCEQFIEQWRKFSQKGDELLNQSSQYQLYRKMRVQQLQLDFIIERLLAYRVITHKIQGNETSIPIISVRAGEYVREWIAGREQ